MYIKMCNEATATTAKYQVHRLLRPHMPISTGSTVSLIEMHPNSIVDIFPIHEDTEHNRRDRQ